ncbi:MAG TPA: serine hydrolase domain-containing protein [Gemmatimonadales bacterium]|nr:serine hydrolase domain-containing protein [Gemmatimonadales bacterium]
MSAQEPGLDSVDRYISAERERQRIPGISVAVLRDNQVLLARGYGLANVELAVPASDSTVYQSGSVGKQFTAAAVLMLAQQRRLSLDDAITRWLPQGVGVWDRVTVRHLLTHTSGIREYTDSTFDYRRDYTEDQLVSFAAARALDFTPGERWSYSNTGYVLLGAVIRRVTGRFYGMVLKELIFSPLEMHSTRIISEAEIVPHRSAGYRLVEGRLEHQEWVAPTLNTTADGSLYVSIRDMIKWAVALNWGTVPGAEVLRMAWTPTRLQDGAAYPYGFGWDLSEQRGLPRIGHTGSWQGFKAAIALYPEHRLTVIALANLAQSEPGAVIEAIAGILEPALQPPHQLTKALPGLTPQLPIDQLLRDLASGKEKEAVTKRFRRFVSPALRGELRQLLDRTEAWTTLGCDRVARQGMTWLGATVERICYAKGIAPEERTIASVYYTADWRAAHLHVSRF